MDNNNTPTNNEERTLTDAEVNEYIIGTMSLQAPQVKQFMASVDGPGLIVALGYVLGMIAAQDSEIHDRILDIANITEECLYPVLLKGTEALPDSGINILFPTTNVPESSLVTPVSRRLN